LKLVKLPPYLEYDKIGIGLADFYRASNSALKACQERLPNFTGSEKLKCTSPSKNNYQDCHSLDGYIVC